MRVFENANYPFHNWRRRAYLVFATLVAIGLIGIIRNVVVDGSWLAYGVDFTGGTRVQVQFDRPVEAEDVRAAVESAGYNDWEISSFGGPDAYVLRMGLFEQNEENDARAIVTNALSNGFSEAEFEILSTGAIGPKVADELQQRALIAILLSFTATLIYLAFRFEWRFGLAAILATSIDIVVTLGYLATTRTEISMGTVAALLTIVGYSLNDKIVVFDRIRENLVLPKPSEDYSGILNRSINETLSRTALTGGGVLATLFSLYFLGGPVIQDFALVLILGIIIGTFSSIFVAAPILYEIEQRSPKFSAKGTKGRGREGRKRTVTV